MPNPQIAAAPPRARPLLDRVQTELGYVPGSLARMAIAPAALQGLLDLRSCLAKSAFPENEQLIIMLATQHAAGISLESVAETDVARVRGLPDSDIDHIREDSTMDSSRLSTLRDFVVQIVDRQGNVAPDQLVKFLAAGFTRSQVFELVMIVMSQFAVIYANRVLGEAPDPATLDIRQ